MPPEVCAQAAFGIHFVFRWLASSRLAQINALVEALQLAAALPLLISLNEQGGKVRRWKPAFGFPPLLVGPAVGRSRTLRCCRLKAGC